MSRRNIFLAAACAAVIGAAGLHVFAAPRDDNRTIDQKATDALAAGRYEAASRFFQMFIDSSVGDPRIAKAQKALHDSTAALAKEWAAEGREADAARLYLWLANDTPADAEKDAIRKQANQLMTKAMVDAKQKRQFARALQLHAEWAKLFPGKPDGYTDQDLARFASEGLLSACQDKFNLLVYPEVLAEFYPKGSGAPPEDLAKRNHNEPLQLSYFRTLADVGWAGRFLAELEDLPKDSALRTNPAFVALVDKMAMAQADAWAAQGNLSAVADAVAAGKTLVSDGKQQAIKAIEAKLGNHLVGKPQDLSFPGPVRGKVGWQDPGSGYQAKDIVIDNDADVTVKAGFTLTEGQIELQRAQMHLHGTAAQPVVFRNVSIALSPGASFDADNAVFINCRFSKAGDSMRFRRARWKFTSCLFYRTEFESLSQYGVGLQMSNCAWVESTLPERNLTGSDLAGEYKDRWNDVANCLFLRTRMAPSTVWMTDQCNFVRCVLSRDSQYDSKTPLNINLFIPEADPMGTLVRSRTLVSDKGDLRYMYSRKAYEVGVPPAFWALLPVEGVLVPEHAKPATEPARDPG